MVCRQQGACFIYKLDKMKYLNFRYIYSHLVMSMRTEILKYERIRNLRIDNTYSQYEIGVTRYPLDAVVTLAQYYQVSVDYLVGLTDETAPYPRRR